jgi:hypothetical protein
VNITVMLLPPDRIPPETQPSVHISHDLRSAGLAADVQERLIVMIDNLRRELSELSKLVVDGRIVYDARGGHGLSSGSLNVYRVTDVPTVRAIFRSAERAFHGIWNTPGITSFQLVFTQTFVKTPTQTAPQPAQV